MRHGLGLKLKGLGGTPIPTPTTEGLYDLRAPLQAAFLLSSPSIGNQGQSSPSAEDLTTRQGMAAVSDYPPSQAAAILGSSRVCPCPFSEGTRFSSPSSGAFHTFGSLPRRHAITTRHFTLTQKSHFMESLSRAMHTPRLGELPFTRASPHSPIEMTPRWLLYPPENHLSNSWSTSKGILLRNPP